VDRVTAHVDGWRQRAAGWIWARSASLNWRYNGPTRRTDKKLDLGERQEDSGAVGRTATSDQPVTNKTGVSPGGTLYVNWRERSSAGTFNVLMTVQPENHDGRCSDTPAEMLVGCPTSRCSGDRRDAYPCDPEMSKASISTDAVACPYSDDISTWHHQPGAKTSAIGWRSSDRMSVSAALRPAGEQAHVLDNGKGYSLNRNRMARLANQEKRTPSSCR